MTDNAYFHLGSLDDDTGDPNGRPTGIMFGPGETVINFSGNAQMIAPNGVFTGGDFSREQLFDLDFPRSDENPLFDDLNPVINISGDATLSFRADVVDDLLAEIYVSQGLIPGASHQLVPDGIEITERDFVTGLFEVIGTANARVFFAESTTPSFDVDDNGEVGFSDFVLFSNAFNSTDPVDFGDFVLFSNAFGQPVRVAAVPEPAGYCPSCFAILGFFVSRRRVR